MIVLDTNVVSALMRRPGDSIVLAWLDRQPASAIWTTAITVFEARFGIELLAEGHRRQELSDRFERLVESVLAGRVLPLTSSEATDAAVVMARLHKIGRPSGISDALIAGIVRARRATLATRNVRHFADAGIDLVNPWDG